MRAPCSEKEPLTSGASMTIRFAVSAKVFAVSSVVVGMAPVPGFSAAAIACGVPVSAAACSSFCSASTCCCAASFSISGPTTRICQPNRTAIDRATARSKLRLSELITKTFSSGATAFAAVPIGRGVPIGVGLIITRTDWLDWVKNRRCPWMASKDTF